MRVIAFNFSPRAEKSNTDLILTPFLAGMSRAGAETERFYGKRLTIRQCRGEQHCYFKTPGRCIHKDSMDRLYPKIREADVWVFATPVYVDSFTSSMKLLMERLTPITLPFVELHEGRCRHPLREGTRSGKVVLVSNCGAWEMANFDPLVASMIAASKTARREFAGALLRPHGEVMRWMLETGHPIQDVFDAAEEAGRQLVRDGHMSPESLRTVGRELLSQDAYVEGINRYMQQRLDEGEAKQ